MHQASLLAVPHPCLLPLWDTFPFPTVPSLRARVACKQIAGPVIWGILHTTAHKTPLGHAGPHVNHTGEQPPHTSLT